MGTITRFGDLEIWQLAMSRCSDFDLLVESTLLAKDFELRNQMNASSGSVMDCIAEGFQRSGNNEFKNLLVIAKGSNGEFRSQLYRCVNRNHIAKEKFDELYAKNIILGKKLWYSYNIFNVLNLKVNVIKRKSLQRNLKLQTSNPKPNDWTSL